MRKDSERSRGPLGCLVAAALMLPVALRDIAVVEPNRRHPVPNARIVAAGLLAVLAWS